MPSHPASWLRQFVTNPLSGSTSIVRGPNSATRPQPITLGLSKFFTLTSGFGAFSTTNDVYSVILVLIFGLIGYFFAKVEIPTTPMILGFILGPMFEENLRRASKLAQSDPITNHPISVVFLVITVVAVALSVRSNMKQKKKAELKE